MFSMLNQKLLGVCLILCISQMVISDADSDCLAGFEFQCNNGDCIPSYKKCNTVKDCADGSDETFEHCYDMDCGESRKCAYGACYNSKAHCNGTSECWDETDENILECSHSDDIFKTFVRGKCVEEIFTQFQCKKSKECINYSNVCDGIPDCRDQTDETLSLCGSTSCSSNAFRCAYGGCIAKAALCDHVYDCIDGSDETASICRKINKLAAGQVWETFGTFLSDSNALPTVTTPAPKIDGKGCNASQSDPALRLRNVYHSLPIDDGSLVPHQMTVRLRCNGGYVLAGTDVNTCINGTWQGNWAECKKVCPRNTIINDLKFTSACSFNDKYIDCTKDPLYVNTIVQIECAQGYISKNNLKYGQRICDSARGWIPNSNSKKLKCVPDCGRIFDTVKEYPWLISIFGSDENKKYSFKCLGVIIDPMYVLTAGACFSGSTSHSAYYAVLGNQSIEFNLAEEHGYDIFTISNIDVVDYQPLALLSLVNPLILSAKIRPICLRNFADGNNTKYSHESLGEPLVALDKTYFLRYISTQKELINVNSFISKFQLYLKEEKIKQKN